MNKKNSNLSRRDFLKGIGLASGGLVIGLNISSCSVKKHHAYSADRIIPNIWISLLKNGKTYLVIHRSEMGQGIRTSLAAVLADEMCADLSYVMIEQATGDEKYGSQNTDGSRSVRNFLTTLRKAGATVKELMVKAGAKHMRVSKKHCYADAHYIHNRKTGEKVFFGDLVERAKSLDLPKDPVLKTASEFKYIGTEIDSLDSDLFISGRAVYGIDTKMEGMVYASLKRTPVIGGKVKSIQKEKTLAFPGVIDVIEIEGTPGPALFNPLASVAVIATNTWAAEQGKKLLEVEWDLEDNENKDYDSVSYKKSLEESLMKKGSEHRNDGDVYTAFEESEATGEHIIEALYYAPHLAHAPMETPAALAWVQADRCDVWASVQTPQNAQSLVSKELDFDKSQVTINVTFLGGGFGRKSKPDYVVEAVKLSKILNKPVKVFWSREDEIQSGYFHSVSGQYHKATIDKDNNVKAWLHRSDFPPIAATFDPTARGPGGGVSQGATTMPYDIENVRVESGDAQAHVRIGWLRSVYSIFHGFSVNSFVDELAHQRKMDPLEHQLSLIGSDRRLFDEDGTAEFKFDTVRLKNVLKKAAKNANWGKKLPKGYGMGLAVQYSFYSYVAQVIEVSVIDNKLKVHEINSVIDCGLVVNKDAVKNQLEGAAVFGLSLSLYGEITAKDGKIQQSNFHDYQMLRMNQSPKINVEIMVTDNPATGVGEPGVPPIAPALTNAVFAATGDRYRELPLSKYGII